MGNECSVEIVKGVINYVSMYSGVVNGWRKLEPDGEST